MSEPRAPEPEKAAAKSGCCGGKEKEEKEGPVNKKPRDTALTQQTLGACKPIFTKTLVTLIFLLVTIIFVPIGVVCLIYGLRAVEVSYRYDDACMPNFPSNVDRQSYLWANAGNNTALSCSVTIPIDKDMSGTVYVYYEVRGMYQNHRRYVRSHMDQQLAGEDRSKWEKSIDVETQAQSCVPLINYENNASQQINPCGLVAWSYFNDTYSLQMSPHGTENNNAIKENLQVQQGGIAFQSDVKKRFGNYTPVNFNPALNKYRGGGNISTTLKEDQRFMVWMRLSHLQRFRKLWGSFDRDLQKGDTVTVNIINQYNVYSFDGEKRIVLSTTTWLGGHSVFLGVAYLATGGVSLIFAVLYLIITLVKPRPFADTRRLKPKTGGVAFVQ